MSVIHVTPPHRTVIQMKGDLIWEQSRKSDKHYIYRQSTGEKILVSRYREDAETFLNSGKKHSTPSHRRLIKQDNGIILEQSTKTGKYYIYSEGDGAKLAVTINWKEAEYLFSYHTSQVAQASSNEIPFEEGKRTKQSYESFKSQNYNSHALRNFYYKVLDLNSDEQVTNQVIKQAYRKMITKYHPDQVYGLGIELQQLAERKTKEINEAYDYLRKVYGF